MRGGMLLTVGAALAALGACSRGSDSGNTMAPQMNEQTGVVTTAQGIQLNATSAVGGCLSPADQRRPPSDFTPEQRRTIVACFNSAAVQQVNPQLPRQIDALTRLDRVSADGPMLTYHYTVLRPAAALPADAVRQIESGTRRMVCAQAPMRQTLELGGSYAYRWIDNQGAPIHQMRIDAC